MPLIRIAVLLIELGCVPHTVSIGILALPLSFSASGFYYLREVSLSCIFSLNILLPRAFWLQSVSSFHLFMRLVLSSVGDQCCVHVYVYIESRVTWLAQNYVHVKTCNLIGLRVHMPRTKAIAWKSPAQISIMTMHSSMSIPFHVHSYKARDLMAVQKCVRAKLVDKSLCW